MLLSFLASTSLTSSSSSSSSSSKSVAALRHRCRHKKESFCLPDPPAFVQTAHKLAYVDHPVVLGWIGVVWTGQALDEFEQYGLLPQGTGRFW